jgi:hypothetical protein
MFSFLRRGGNATFDDTTGKIINLRYNKIKQDEEPSERVDDFTIDTEHTTTGINIVFTRNNNPRPLAFKFGPSGDGNIDNAIISMKESISRDTEISNSRDSSELSKYKIINLNDPAIIDEIEQYLRKKNYGKTKAREAVKNPKQFFSSIPRERSDAAAAAAAASED